MAMSAEGHYNPPYVAFNLLPSTIHVSRIAPLDEGPSQDATHCILLPRLDLDRSPDAINSNRFLEAKMHLIRLCRRNAI